MSISPLDRTNQYPLGIKIAELMFLSGLHALFVASATHQIPVGNILKPFDLQLQKDERRAYHGSKTGSGHGRLVNRLSNI